MIQYIPKAALVAEIERLKVHSEEAIQEFGRDGYMDNVLFEQSKIRTCETLLSFLDTIEVKEVDLEKATEKNLWKPADGDDLPDIDREVIALLDNGKVVFAHRPPEYWDGKDIITGKVTRNYVERYDKGMWNIPNVKYWLDVELPK